MENLQQDEQEVPVIGFDNTHMQVWGSSAVWDEDDSQIVAGTMFSNNMQDLKAFFASQVTNSRKTLILRLSQYNGQRDRYLHSIQRKPSYLRKSTSDQNVRGYIYCFEHPAALDPRNSPETFFYVLAKQDEDIREKFIAHLNIAIAWPVQPEWGSYLLENGEYVGAVKNLPILGKDWSGAYRVTKSNSVWEDLIVAGLEGGSLSLN